MKLDLFRKILTAAALLFSAATAVVAQEFKTSLFLDNYVYSYRLNPGAPLDENSSTFFSLGIGNISASALSNLGYSSLVFNVGGEPRWGIDDQVSVEEFLSGLDDNNILQPLASVNVLTIGHQTDASRFSVELNVRSNSFMSISKEIAGQIKRGLNEGLQTLSGTYGFDNWPGVNSSNYAELAVNYAHSVGDRLVLGATAKGLLGIAGGHAWIDRLRAYENDGNFTGDLNGGAELAMQVYDLKNGKFGKIGFSGYGAALDLGASFEAFDGFTLGLSVLDLGFLRWNYNFNYHADYTGRKINSRDDILDGMKELPQESETLALDWNVHLSAQYKMPFYDKWNVGVLGTLQKNFKEVRLGTGITPVNFLSLAVSAARNTYGFDLGAGLNLRFPGVNFFLGLDSIYFRMTPNLLPADRGITNATAGLAIAF